MLVMLHMVPTLLSMVLVLLRPTMSSDTLSPTPDTELLSTPLMLESAPTISVSRCLAKQCELRVMTPHLNHHSVHQ